MKLALDTSFLVAFFVPSDASHAAAETLVNEILNGHVEYACMSYLNVAEMGYILERIFDSQTYAYHCMMAAVHDLSADVLDVSWDFLTTLAHLKAVNPISFCDNATIASAALTDSAALFIREKEIVARSRERIQGAEVLFLDEIQLPPAPEE
ncbi:MAG TPA: PIN domain-containing protein [Candidatus Lokiarchaeia archaeon]|nr:PIN domain-containing protein [Candidatus Lokiarchaeia archaeon]